MKKDDLTTKSPAELKHDLAAQQARLAQMKFDLADKKLKKTSDIPQIRRSIARIMTSLSKLATKN